MRKDQATTSQEHDTTENVTRRDFVRTGTAIAGVGVVAGSVESLIASTANVGASDTVRVGVIGCGGRGTGAALNTLEAAPNARITALADLFGDRLDGSRKYIAEHGGERGRVEDEMCFTGFEAYADLIKRGDVNMVILATPPHFRPIHLEAAIRAKKHVFMEKPVAVDPVGIRQVIAAADEAEKHNLSIVAGTQRRHEQCYLEGMERLQDGAIGDVVAARCYWNQGGLWVHEPRSDWTDMEWQIRNWLYFTWLSGDHIVEQHVHNLDAMNWAMGGHPIKAMGMGGRQVRTESKFGHIFDHFAIEYEYEGGRFGMSMCRQIDGCASRVSEAIHGTKGRLLSSSGWAAIEGENQWRFEGKQRNPYVQEHADLHASVRGEGSYLNEGRRIAESTLTAIMGRMSAYTGKEVTWDQAMNSKLDLAPKAYEFGSIDVPPVAVPGKTPLV